ncbi:MAG: hypothetical protein HN348_34260, partial [Proteobacteria bacterium]|nr:hypothetical protein [Pseudomonadota bacterium]
TQSDIGPVFLVFIGICLVYAVVLLALRSPVLEAAATPSKRSIYDPLGREFSVLLQNVLFTVFAFTVLLGTLFPLIAEALDGRRVSVGAPYFERWALPLGVAIVFFMGVGPALPWGRLAARRVSIRLGAPILFALALTAMVAVLGIQKPFTLLSLFVCAFALYTNGFEFLYPMWVRIRSHGENPALAFWRAFGRTRRRFGAHISHFGIVMAVVAIALSKGYKEEHDVMLRPNESAQIGRYEVVFQGPRTERQPNRTSEIAVFAADRSGRAINNQEPRLNRYRTMLEPIGSPSIHTNPVDDLYLSLLELPLSGEYVNVRLMTLPAVIWLWISGLVISLGTVLVLWGSKRGGQR